MNVQILGIGASSAFSQKTLADSLELPYPLLSDFPEPKVIRLYGVAQEYSKDPQRVVAQRSFFLIDEQGILRGRWLARDDQFFPGESILEMARQIRGRSF